MYFIRVENRYMGMQRLQKGLMVGSGLELSGGEFVVLVIGSYGRNFTL